MPIIRDESATTGAITPTGANDIKPLASAIISPQSGVGGDTPNPKNDSDEKASSIHDQRIAPSTIRVSRTFGRSSRRITVILL